MYGLTTYTRFAFYTTTLNTNNSTNIALIKAALKELTLDSTLLVTSIAKNHNINRYTLLRRFRSVTKPSDAYY